MLSLSTSQAKNNFRIALFESAYRNRGAMPVTRVGQGSRVFRAIKANEPYSTPRGARTLHPSADGQENRWDGKVSDSIAQGALNTSLDSVGVMNEALYYSRNPRNDVKYEEGSRWHSARGTRFWTLGPVQGKVLIQKSFYVFRLRHSVDLVDLHMAHERVWRFLRTVQEDRLVQAALSDLRSVDLGSRSLDLHTALQAPDQGAYSLDRSIGVAALKHGATAGVEAEGHHFELPAIFRSMGNALFSGNNGEELTFLVPEREVARGRDASGAETWVEREVSVNDTKGATKPNTLIDCEPPAPDSKA